MRLDAHQHYWQLENQWTNWPTEDLQAIYKDFLPENLAAHLKKHQIKQSIVVQAAPTEEETKFLLELADNHQTIAGVVGWLDLADPSFPERFFHYKQHAKFIGIRPMLQDLSDDRWILRPDVKSNLKILVENDFPIDLLIYPKHLPSIIELLSEFPGLRAVVNHCAKPNIKDQEWATWAEGIAKIAQYPSTMCKISGLITEADHQTWKPADIKPYIEHVYHVFGEKRVMFGSDWPVCLLAGTYDDVINIVEETIPQDHAAFFGKNAQSFYKVDK
ncbi:amidohydrolase [Bacillus sp. J14TS2]|uniref:amidohydrolase family protein n=1 Tax=Bacillus sp. J14TS2 TaxID=2807188 RepID=UPI001B206B4B|nr:amidohydrolase family protein [Bacillus sp. J14TS2]GIN72525.1 amidohydrolase [Bacillus sp. J14TS2]